jgi:pilus assembly protein Flp/PilA
MAGERAITTVVPVGSIKSAAHESRRITVDVIACWNWICSPFMRGRFARTERGASLVEYALLVALIAVVCIAAISFVGTSASSTFNSVGSSIANP